MATRVDKNELLESIDTIKYEHFDVSYLIITFLVAIIVILFIFPKIYLSNQIYYKSRSINKLLDDYEILKEENRLLKQKLEYQRYKNLVLGSMYEE